MMNVVRRHLACLSLLLLLLLLIMLQLKTVDGHGRFNRFRSGSPSSSDETRHRGRSHGFYQRGAEKDGNGGNLFGVDKRKVHTGPNPLHNR